MTSSELSQQHCVRWKVGDPPISAGPLFCAIGNFDGVHTGHQKVLSTMIQKASGEGMKAGIVSFSPHPRRYFKPDEPSFLLMDETQRMHQLITLGCSPIIMIEFNEELQRMNASDFVSDVLVSALDIRHLFAGSDFCFGRNREGDMEFLTKAGQKLGMTTQPVSLLGEPNVSTPVSSSRIREALRQGKPEYAAQMLGRPHYICGVVQRGDQRGRDLGFPTANLVMESVLHPAYGVYAVTVQLEDGRKCGGVSNIGRRPTVNDRGVLCETFLFDFDDQIYGQQISVNLHRFLRGEIKFESLEQLQQQIETDSQSAKAVLAQIDADLDAS